MKLLYEGMPTKEEVMERILIPTMQRRFEGKKTIQEYKQEPIVWVEDDGTIRSSDELFDEETVTSKGAITDSGDERNMTMSSTLTKEAMRGLELLGRKADEEDLTTAVLLAADRHASPISGGETDLYDDLPPNRNLNLELTEENVVEAASHDTGITHENQRSEDINEYSSPEGIWTKRTLEQAGKKKPESKATAADEEAVISAATRR